MDESHGGGDERRNDERRNDEVGGNDRESGNRSTDDRENAYELLQRGTALMRGRHNAQAAVVLERAARLEPGRGSILEALGRAYFNSSQHRLARDTFRRLLEVDPSSPYGHFALGQSLKRLGDSRAARTHLRLAVALDPHSPLYRGALARLGPGPRRSSADGPGGEDAGTTPAGATGDAEPASDAPEAVEGDDGPPIRRPEPGGDGSPPTDGDEDLGAND